MPGRFRLVHDFVGRREEPAADAKRLPLARHKHEEARTEASLGGSNQIEAACRVKVFCVGVTDYVEERGCSCAGDLDAMGDEAACDPTTSHVGLDKQGIEFALSIGASRSPGLVREARSCNASSS